MKVSVEEKKRLQQIISALRTERQPFWMLWRELADYILPKRYVWLQSDRERRVRNAKNPYILDSTGTKSARILSSGMMNGITSPSRPWFKLTIPGYDDEGGPVTLWCDEVARRMMMVMGISNFYNSMAILYLDLAVFGTAANLIYEDYEKVICCYNPALGEYYLGQDYRLHVDTFAREYCQTVKQVVTKYGEENVSSTVAQQWKRGGEQALAEVKITHLIEPNVDGKSTVPEKFKFRETYWETSFSQDKVLSQRGFNEMPGIFPRWELTANDSYGTSPGMDALGDIIQLQQETKRKAQGLDKMINPPILADIQLEHRPTALLPNGITYIAGNANSFGAKPLYEVRAPIQDMTSDIRDVQVRIQETFYNPLFNMISQLETVRSATEIDARREEKLILLGPVLERFENEALDPAITRIFSIMQRRNLLPPAPPGLEDAEIEIQYVSILATAQRALQAAPTERWLALIGNVSPIAPQVTLIPDWDEVVRSYGIAIGVEARSMRPREVVAAETQAQQEQQAAQQAAETTLPAVQAGKLLSETDVGGGANALQQLLAAGGQ